MRAILIHDLKDPDDAQGRTYREVNLATAHAIPLGALVELRGGARGFVVCHHRDCDGTPLYAVGWTPDAQVWGNPSKTMFSGRVHHGLPAYWLTVIDPSPPPPED